MTTPTETPDFADTSFWEQRPGVNVFDVHDRKLVRQKRIDGKLHDETVSVSFKKSDLERIALRCNERDKTGNFCPLTLGHTLDGRPENEQPTIVGYAREFHVMHDPVLKRDVIKSTLYIRKDRLAAAKEYPRISVEYWHDKEFFDPISLLKRTPARDLGQWTYARGNPSQLVLRYAMPEEVIEKKEEVKEKPEKDPTLAPGGPEGVPPEFSEHFQKCMSHHYPKMAEMHSKYGMGAAGPMSGGLPGPVPPPMPPGPPPPMHDNLRLAKVQADIDAAKLQTQNTSPEVLKLQKDFEEMKAWRDANEKESRLLRYERDLTQFAIGRRIDLVKEMNRVQNFTPDQFAAHMQLLEEFAPRDPVMATPNRWLPTDNAPRPVLQYDKGSNKFQAVGGPESRSTEKVFDEAALARATKYMETHENCEWEEARDFALNGESKAAVPVR